MPLALPILLEMVANVGFVSGIILGARVALFAHKFLRRGL